MRSVCGPTSAVARIKWPGLPVFMSLSFCPYQTQFAVWRRGRVCAGQVGLVAGFVPWKRPLKILSHFSRYVLGGGSGSTPQKPRLARQVLRFEAMALLPLKSLGRSNFFSDLLRVRPLVIRGEPTGREWENQPVSRQRGIRLMGMRDLWPAHQTRRRE